MLCRHQVSSNCCAGTLFYELTSSGHVVVSSFGNGAMLRTLQCLEWTPCIRAGTLIEYSTGPNRTRSISTIELYNLTFTEHTECSKYPRSVINVFVSCCSSKLVCVVYQLRIEWGANFKLSWWVSGRHEMLGPVELRLIHSRSIC